jgi:hypothetical protein
MLSIARGGAHQSYRSADGRTDQRPGAGIGQTLSALLARLHTESVPSVILVEQNAERSMHPKPWWPACSTLTKARCDNPNAGNRCE